MCYMDQHVQLLTLLTDAVRAFCLTTVKVESWLHVQWKKVTYKLSKKKSKKHAKKKKKKDRNTTALRGWKSSK